MRILFTSRYSGNDSGSMWPLIVLMEMVTILQHQSLPTDVVSNSEHHSSIQYLPSPSRHLVLVNEALRVKKSDHHDLACGFLLANFHRTGSIFPLPELILSFG